MHYSFVRSNIQSMRLIDRHYEVVLNPVFCNTIEARLALGVQHDRNDWMFHAVFELSAVVHCQLEASASLPLQIEARQYHLQIQRFKSMLIMFRTVSHLNLAKDYKIWNRNQNQNCTSS